MIVLAALLPALLALAAPAAAPAQKKYILQGGTIINGVFTRPLKDHLVIVEGGRITGVGRKNTVILPKDAEVIDVTGKYIMPGLIDVHVHEDAKADWPRYLAWGITSVNCMYEVTDTALAREAWSLQDTVRSPRIFAAAPVFTTKGGWWEGDAFPVDPSVDRFPTTSGDARAAIRALNAKGVRRIKLMVDDMGWCRDPLPRLAKMDTVVMNALLDEARKLNIVTEVHAPELADAASAVAGGANILVHGIVDRRVDAPLVETLLYSDGYYVPTFSLYRFLAGADTFMTGVFSDPRFRASLPPATVDSLTGPAYAARYRERYPNIDYVRSRLGVLDDNMATFLSNYAQIALGTDMWALPGIGAHVELELMVKAGMTPMQALTSATFLSAKAIRIFSKTGTIEPGKDADILVLDADPLADIKNTRSISMVIKMGRIFRPAELLGTAGR